MNLSKLCLGVFLCCILCNAKVDTMVNDKIVELPGQPKVDFNQFGGYVTVDAKKGRALYYYFVDSPQNSPNKPLLLWLNGGPGCSSLGFGAMKETGPFRVNKDSKTLSKNFYSWNKVANVLYVESPIGTGFSYSNTSSDYNSIDDDNTTTDLYNFLINWIERFPQYKESGFFIAGESYAGRIIPRLAQLILHNNKIKKHTTFNLRGIVIGNPSIDSFVETEEQYKFLWSHVLIPEEIFQTMKDCNYTYQNGKKCNDATERMAIYMGGIDAYNIDNNPECDDTLGTSESYSSDPCLGTYTKAYLNIHAVQKALHANVTNLSPSWEFCRIPASTVTEYKAIEILPIIAELIAERLNIWIYSGDTDSVIPTFATRRAIKSLRIPIKNEWQPWYYKNVVGGYLEEYDGLTFVTFRGAGHMVPADQPERAFVMISHFLEMSLPL